MDIFAIAAQPHQMAPTSDHVFELVRRKRVEDEDGRVHHQSTFIIGQLGSRYVTPEEAKDLVRRMQIGLNLRDVTRKHVTVCGYTVRNLCVTISHLGEVVYSGEYFGAEQFWSPRKWDASGVDFGEQGPTQMDLLYAD